MELQEKAKLLSAESKPYSFNGLKGVSHKVRLSVEGEVYECNSTEEQVTEFKPLVGKSGTVHFKLESRKERLSMKVLAFKV